MAEARADDRDDEPVMAEREPAARVRPDDGRADPEIARAREHDARDAGHRSVPHGAQSSPGAAPDAPELGRNPEVEESAVPPHEPGSMDITQCEETYHRFVGIVIRAVIGIFVVLILLALING